MGKTHATRQSNFYPRPPRGGRLNNNTRDIIENQFLSTPSARRATRVGHKEHHRMDNFYPRPPRGGRRHGQVSQGNRKNFYPRPPRGGRHNTEAVKLLLKEFLSTPSARRATDRP